MRKSEILAPVGNEEMLYAGLVAGADAFYMASDDFGARAYAENFNIDNIKSYIDLIHLFSKRVYLTMNTLIKDSEMEKAISYATRLYEYGVDGLIIQDLGFFTLIRDKLDGMEFHASTQMAVRDYHGAKALMDLGFDRVVIARECPIDEIRKIDKLPIAKEVFVHGSLCVSYSGECLMSSYFGGRSANRGRCAGICRKKYRLVNDGKTLGEDYYLSMKDLNVIDRLEDLIDAGADSLKIEGRMKTADYVYRVVKSYRSKIDKDSYDRDELRDSSNRGFTEGFIFGQNRDNVILQDGQKHRSVGKVKEDKKGKYFVSTSELVKGDNLSVETVRGKILPLTTDRSYAKGQKIYLDNYKDAKVNSDIFLLNSPRLRDELRERLEDFEKLPIEIKFTGHVGRFPEISLTYKDYRAEFSLDKSLERAKNISLSQDDIRKSLAKFGNDIFEPVSINIDMDEDIFIRKKDLNELRRKGSEYLKAEILKSYHRDRVEIDLPSLEPTKTYPKERNIDLLTTKVDPDYLRDFDKVYIRTFDEKYRGLDLYLNLDPHIDYDIEELIPYLKEKSIGGVIFNNYKDLDFVDDFKRAGIKIRIGSYLNVFNSYTAAFYEKFAEMITLSVESTYDQIKAYTGRLPAEVMTYGRVELMNMRYCPFSVIKKCGLVGCETCKFNDSELINEDGDYLKIIRYSDHSIIYPKVPARADEKRLGDNISTLVQVFDNGDFDTDRHTNKLNYDRGVI